MSEHRYRRFCSEVAPGLWIGSTPANAGETDPMFNVVVQLYSSEPYNYHAHQVLVTATMFDTATNPLNPFPDDKLLKNLARLTALAVARMKPVLVHCHQGLNRSGLVAALALCRMGVKPEAAVMQVMQRRQGSLFNRQFVEWILTNGVKI